MVTQKYLQWLTGIALVTALAAPAQAERMLARHQDLEAFIPDNAACGSTYQVIMRTTDSSSFSGGKTKVQRLLGGIRAILSLECPEAKNIIITGQVQGQQVYRGAASETGNWTLVDIPEAPKEIAQVKQHGSGLSTSPDAPQKKDPDISEKRQEISQNFDNIQAAIDKEIASLAHQDDQLERENEKLEQELAESERNVEQTDSIRHKEEDTAEDSGNITECDHLAADPYDPNRTTKGVAFSDIDANKAIDTCMEALTADSENIRIKYQLGRALIAGEIFDDAVSFLQEAVNVGYVPANFYLAIPYIMGLGVEQDEETGTEFLKAAAAGGYVLAKEKLAEIEQEEAATAPDVDALPSLESASGDPSQEQYSEPELVSAILQGRLEAVPDDQDTRRHVGSILRTFINQCGIAIPDEVEPAAHLYMNPKAKNPMHGVNAFGEMLHGALNGGLAGALDATKKNYASLSRDGVRDGRMLVNQYGCDGPEAYRMQDSLFDIVLSRRNREPGSAVPEKEMQAEAGNNLAAVDSKASTSDHAAPGPGNPSTPQDQYNKPELVLAIYQGRFEAVPDDQDTRRHIGSMIYGLTKVCFEDLPLDVSTALQGYVNPDVQELMKNPEHGLKMLGDFLKDTAEDAVRRANGLDPQKQRPLFTLEGLRDGRMFFKQSGCDGAEAFRMKDNLFDIIESRGDRKPSKTPSLEPQASPENPIISKTGPFTAIKYGRVGNDFVLQIPSPHPEIPFSVEVKDRAPGTLWRLSVKPFNQGSPHRTVFDYPEKYRDTIYKDYHNVGQRHLVINCEYVHTRGSTYSHTFWFKANPPKFDRRQLDNRIPNHPLLTIGDAKEGCPITKVEADRG